MRLWPCLLVLAAVQPVSALAASAPYYGPMKTWTGLGFKDAVEKDGTWRIEAGTRGREPVDLAMYRAAERARDAGYAYVELLGGIERHGPAGYSATLYARPSHSPAMPAVCRSKRKGTCYTADVGEVLRILGGPDGTQPGVAIVDHVDADGSQVFLSGYGTGMASATPRAAVLPTLPPPPRFVPPPPPSAVRPRIADASARATTGSPTTLADRLKAAQPVRGRDKTLGWTISD